MLREINKAIFVKVGKTANLGLNEQRLKMAMKIMTRIIFFQKIEEERISAIFDKKQFKKGYDQSMR